MAEKRLIDANELYAQLEEIRIDYIEEDTLSSDFAANVIELVQDEYLAKSPTVDAVEVVRCKDCAHGDMCSIREAMACTDDNGFCWRGKRRTDGDS